MAVSCLNSFENKEWVGESERLLRWDLEGTDSF